MREPVLIVIPCLNEAAHLDHLIATLLAEAQADDLLAVADGGSTDGSVEIVERWSRRDPRVRLVRNAARLQSAGVNAAVAAHGGDRSWLVRVDAHARYPEGFVARLLAAAQATGADSVVVPMRTVGGCCFQEAAATAQNSVIGAGGSAHRVGGASGWIDHGHHALMRREAFEAIGGYNPAFSHNEDAEFDLRLTAGGGRIWFQGDLAIDYVPRRTPAALLRQYVNHGRGRARTVRLHKARLKLRQLVPAAVAPAVVAGVLAPAAALIHPAGWMLAAPTLLWLVACLVGGVAAAVAARAPACGYASGFAAMIMHFGWSLGFLSGLTRSPR